MAEVMSENPTPEAVAAIVKGLTKEDAAAVLHLNDAWSAGPDLPDSVLALLNSLRDAGLVERNFLDMGPPRHSASKSRVSFRLAACWHFRLLPAGLAVRQALIGESA